MNQTPSPRTPNPALGHRLQDTPTPTTPIQKLDLPQLQHKEMLSVRQFVISDPAIVKFLDYQTQLMGYPPVVWQQQKEKACIITYNNTHLHQKPIPIWDISTQLNFDQFHKSTPTTHIILTLTMDEIRTGTMICTIRTNYNSNMSLTI